MRETARTTAGEAEPLTLTIAEAARHLRRSRAWGYKAAVNGTLPTIRTVAGLRVRRADLLGMIGVVSEQAREHVEAAR